METTYTSIKNFQSLIMVRQIEKFKIDRRAKKMLFQVLRPLENYWCYVNGPTDNINLDRYFEYALILLQLQQNSCHSANANINLFNESKPKRELFQYIKEEISLYTFTVWKFSFTFSFVTLQKKCNQIQKFRNCYNHFVMN